jgi:hypothetical protein
MTGSLDARVVLDGLFNKLKVDSARRTFASTPHLRAVASPERRDNGVWVSVHIHPEHGNVPWPLPSCGVRIAGSNVTAELTATGRLILGPVGEGEYQLCLASPKVIQITSPALSRQLGDAIQERLAPRRAWGSRPRAGDVLPEQLAAAPQTPGSSRDTPLDVVSPDGRFRIRVLEDEDDRIVLRVVTSELALERSTLRVSLEGVSGECVLERVAEDQLLGEVAISITEAFLSSTSPLVDVVIVSDGRA